jgi:putative ABC transport system substrate-binding protein
MNRRAFITGLGAVLAAPVATEAQQAGKIPRIGFLSSGKRVSPDHPYLAAITDGLRDAGYVVGRNIVIEWQFAENDPDKLPGLVTRLIRSDADVFLCATTAEVLAVKNATTTIPVVMLGTGDPVGLGFAQSLARPGGNITGLSILRSRHTRRVNREDLLNENCGSGARVSRAKQRSRAHSRGSRRARAARSRPRR